MTIQEPGVRVVDTNEYVSVLRELTEQGHEVSIRISGSSMAPFLCHGRDDAWFKKPDRPLKKGDIVFYQRDNGQFVLHRIGRIKGQEYYLVGDNQSVIEGPLRRDQIFGLVTKVKRKGKIIKPGDFWWWFFRVAWVHLIPMRRVIQTIYSKIS